MYLRTNDSFKSAKKLGSAKRKWPSYKSTNYKKDLATLAEGPQICGFAICRTYWWTAHLCNLYCGGGGWKGMLYRLA